MGFYVVRNGVIEHLDQHVKTTELFWLTVTKLVGPTTGVKMEFNSIPSTVQKAPDSIRSAKLNFLIENLE